MKVLAFGEIMMRLSVEDERQLPQSDTFKYSFGGTGFNFLSGLNNFGVNTSLLSMLPDNNLGKAAQRYIKSYINDASCVKLTSGHLGTYIIEQGFGYRPSEVTYMDRTLSSFNTTKLDSETIEKSLEAVTHLHICGIALTTSTISKENVMKLVKRAQEKSIKIIFDFNYRPKLNDNIFNKEDYETLLHAADIVFGSKYDIINLLGYENTDDLETLFKDFMKSYQIDIFAGTIKDKYDYQGFMLKNDRLFLSNKLVIKDVKESIGTGDAYASRLVSGILHHEEPEITVEKAMISGLLAHTLYGDVVSVNEQMIDAFNYEAYARIIR